MNNPITYKEVPSHTMKDIILREIPSYWLALHIPTGTEGIGLRPSEADDNLQSILRSMGKDEI